MRREDSDFYVTGGTIPRDARCYVERHADAELVRALSEGEFCYVLTPRQMGKSSLMVRTAARLRAGGCAVAVLDLTAIGQNLSAEQWYDGLLNRLGAQFALEDSLDAHWCAHSRIGPLQRFMSTLKTLLLPHVLHDDSHRSLVIFIDEIDTVRSLPFSTDEFFAAIRECYNGRSEDPSLSRLTFCLLGVATPSDLIRDTRLTPFNIGRRIDLEDFTEEEAVLLTPTRQPEGLSEAGQPDGRARRLLRRVLYWTNGHPYLTQRLCRSVAETNVRSTRDVDRLCQDLFLSPKGRERDNNLLFVRERILRSDAGPVLLLDLYRKVWLSEQLVSGWGRRVADDPASPIANALALSGITRKVRDTLRVRNRIYRHVFNSRWVSNHLPSAEVLRQGAAFRRGLAGASAAGGVLVALVGGLAALAIREAGEAKVARATTLRSLDLARQREVELDGLTTTLRAALGERGKALAEKDAALAARMRALKQAEAARSGATRHAQAAEFAQRLERSQRLRAEQAERAAVSRLWDSHLARARAGRWSGRAGRRFEGLQSLRAAAAIRPALSLRNEAIACLTLADLGVLRQWTIQPQSGMGAEFDSSVGRYAVPQQGGAVSIRRVSDHAELLNLPGPGAAVEWVLRFSPKGRHLAVAHEDGAQTYLRVWDLQSRRCLWKVPSVSQRAVDFSPDSQRIAVGAKDGVVTVYDVATGEQIQRHPLNLPDPYEVRFDPGGRRLAVSTLRLAQVRVIDATTGSPQSLAHRTGVRAVAWSPDGKQLATAGLDNALRIWDLASGAETGAPIRHENITRVAFDPSGRVLATYAWDGMTRLWDARSRRELVSTVGEFRVFSPNGKQLAFGLANYGAGIWQLATGSEHRQLQPTEHLLSWSSVHVSPNNRLAAITYAGGADLWDLGTGRRLGGVVSSEVRDALFDPAGRHLITSGDRGLEVWPLSMVAGELRTGPSQRLTPGQSTYFSGISADGLIVAAPVRSSLRVLVVSVRRRAILFTLEAQAGVEYAAVSPLGKWVAAGTWKGKDVRIWDASAGKLAHTLPIPMSARPAFSPDGRWLITSTGADYSVWEVGSWRLHRRFPRDRSVTLPGPISFTRDGRLMAIASSATVVQLRDPASGMEMAALDLPRPLAAFNLALAPDGSCLVSCRGETLDLRRVRQQLAALQLDWVSPPAPRRPQRKPSAVNGSRSRKQAPPRTMAGRGS